MLWPRGEAGSPFEGDSFPFYTLEPDPTDNNVVYGGLSGDTVAVTVDGGATWIMSDGATEPAFGDACVPHRSAAVLVLLQGYELPLDTAWVGARRVVEQDRFSLPDFRFLYGYPNLEELENRRINAMAGVTARPDRVLVGRGRPRRTDDESGNWIDRDDITANWIMRVEQSDSHCRTHTSAASRRWMTTGQHLLFGGTVNGVNKSLSLFEVEDGNLSTVGTADFA